VNARRQGPEIVALLLLFLATTGMTVVGFGWTSWAPPVASEHGVGVDGVISYLLFATGGILVIGTVALMWFLWAYSRRSCGEFPRPRPRTEGFISLIPVLVMALVSEAGVLLKGLPVWEQVYGEPPEGALVVEATGKQFALISIDSAAMFRQAE